MLGSASTITTSTLSIVNPSVGIIISSSTALLTSFAILITNEYLSKLKIGYTKLRDWFNAITLLYEKTSTKSMGINVISLLYEKTLTKSMVDKKIRW